MTVMWDRIPLGPDNFKRVVKYQTLRTLFYGGFESLRTTVTFVTAHLLKYSIVRIIQ